MCEPKSFQNRLSVFELKPAENGRPSFSTSKVVFSGRNSTVEKWTEKKRIIIVLLDSGGSINLISDKVYKQLGDLSQIRMSDKIVIAANEEIDLSVNSSQSSSSEIYI